MAGLVLAFPGASSSFFLTLLRTMQYAPLLQLLLWLLPNLRQQRTLNVHLFSFDSAELSTAEALSSVAIESVLPDGGGAMEKGRTLLNTLCCIVTSAPLEA